MKLNFFNWKLSLRRKFLVMFLILSIIPVAIVGSISYYIARQSVIELGEVQLKKSVDTAYQMAEELNKRVEKGEIALYFAQESLKEQLVGPKTTERSRELKNKSLSFADDDYLFAYNSDGTAVMHPFLEGTNQHNDQVVEAIISQKEGSYTFDTSNSADEPLRTKITYMRYFEPWDWIIVNGAWEDNFYSKTNYIKNLTIGLIIATLIFIIGISYFVAKLFVNPINQLSSVMTLMGIGDFTERANVKSNDELQKLADNMNMAMDSVTQLIEEVMFTSTQLARSSELLSLNAVGTNKSVKEVAESVEEINQDLLAQESNVESISGLIEELAASYQQISANTSHVSGQADLALQAGEKGIQLVQDMTNQMNLINKSVKDSGERISQLQAHSEEIGNIIAIITEISSQTNLLALNAAIEAARAGEHGRGFAVVAEEVRKLAEQTAVSAQQVKNRVESIQKETKLTVLQFAEADQSVKNGIQFTKQTRDSFKVILDSVQDVAKGLNEVAMAIEQMASGTSDAVEDVSQIANVASGISSRSEQLKSISANQVTASTDIANSAKQLADIVDKLEQLLSKFHTG